MYVGLGLPINAAFKSIFLMISLCTAGNYITRFCGQLEFHHLSRLSIDFLIGGLIFVIPRTLLLTIFEIHVSPYLFIAVAVFVNFISTKKFAPHTFSWPPKTTLNVLHEIHVSLLLTMSCFSLQYPTLAPILICGIGSYVVCTKIKLNGVALLLSSFAPVIISVFIRSFATPQTPISSNNDQGFYESASWLIAEFGLNDHPSFVHGTLSDYHWYTYAFTGLIDKSMGLDPFITLNLIIPFGVLFAITSLLFGLFLERTMNYSHAVFYTLFSVILFTLVHPISPMNALVFSNFALLILIVILNHNYLQKNTVGSHIILFLVYFSILFSKSSSGLIAFSFIFGYVFFSYSFKKILSWTYLLTATFVLSLALLTQYSSTSKSLLQFNHSISLIPNRIYILFFSPYFIVSVCLFSIVLMKTKIFQAGNKDELLLKLSVIISFTFLIFKLVLLQGQAWDFFSQSTQLITILLLISVISTDNTFFSPRYMVFKWQITFIFLAFISGIIWGYIHGRLSDGFFQQNMLFWGIWSVFIAGWSLLRIFMRSNFLSISNLLFVSTVVVCFSSLGIRFQQELLNRHIYDSVLIDSIGSSDARDMSRYIRIMTAVDAVMASNNFCQVEVDKHCFGTMWFDTELEKYSDNKKLLLLDTPDKFGGSNYSLVANSRRRFLVQGLRFISLYEYPDAEMIKRMKVSIAFANSPSARSFQELKSYGVSGFVVNLHQTLNRNWMPFAFETYRNSTYAYLQLN